MVRHKNIRKFQSLPTPQEKLRDFDSEETVEAPPCSPEPPKRTGHLDQKEAPEVLLGFGMFWDSNP